jgi:hypothetical protein
MNSKPLKIKHLKIFFFSFFANALKAHPTKPPTRPARWHDFCSQEPRFFYTLSIHLNKLNKNSKTLENQGLEPLSKSLSMLLRWLLSKLALLLKTYDNKAPPTPPLAQHRNKTVENQALHDAN